MNKRQARLFAIVSTGIAVFAFLALTVHSHTKFDELTNQKNNTPQVQSGRDVWHKYNCVNCHTLFGEGAYYAPDLTKITQLRGEQYLKAYMRDPSAFYDEQRHRRLMPKQDLSEREIDDLIAFLDWVSKVDNQGWPPRPILVTGRNFGCGSSREHAVWALRDYGFDVVVSSRFGDRLRTCANVEFRHGDCTAARCPSGQRPGESYRAGRCRVSIGIAGMQCVPFDGTGREHGRPFACGRSGPRRSR